jgi:4-amino-4-deoxy-L-arabinose transferase-like glycosyltransferase
VESDALTAAVDKEITDAAQPYRKEEGELKRFDPYPWVLGILVALSRVAASGAVYYVDGPAHLKAIRSRVFVIQPPGYWLFNRLAGLFSNPAAGIHLMNWFFSVAGVVIFYYAARLLVSRNMATLGSALYAVIFYAWFSGGVHSTYASQLLFPILVFFFLLLHMKSPRAVYLVGASLAYGIGAGLRPSDGVFIGLMFLYYLLRHATAKQAVLSLGFATLVSLFWFLPTIACYRAIGLDNAYAHVRNVTTTVSILTSGVNYRSLANIGRFLVPLACAFWPLAWAIRRSLKRLGDQRVVLLWLWIIPGASFLILSYMSDAPYLNFLTPAILLLGMMGMDAAPPSWRVGILTLCIAWNLCFFLFFEPIPTRSVAIDAVNVFAGKYTAYGIRNHWQPNLSSLHDVNAPFQ